MIIEEALVEYLGDLTPITNLVASRIYPLRAPQGTLEPYIVYQRISTVRSHSHSGSSHHTRARMQFSIVTKTYADARAISAAVRNALDGVKVNMGEEAIPTDSFIENEDDEWIEDSEVYVTRMDAMIWHTEV